MLVSYVLDKSLLPRTLKLVLCELSIEFSMCLATDLRVCRSPISLPLISIIESAFRQFQTAGAEEGNAYLKPLLEYAAAAERMMWAVADLPTPPSRRLAIVVSLSILPVKMNVLDIWSGSLSKLKAACCAATNALVVLTCKSRLKSAKGIDKGSAGLFGAPADASKVSAGFRQSASMRNMVTIVNNNTWQTERCFDFRKDALHGMRIR